MVNYTHHGVSDQSDLRRRLKKTICLPAMDRNPGKGASRNYPNGATFTKTGSPQAWASCLLQGAGISAPSSCSGWTSVAAANISFISCSEALVIWLPSGMTTSWNVTG